MLRLFESVYPVSYLYLSLRSNLYVLDNES